MEAEREGEKDRQVQGPSLQPVTHRLLPSMSAGTVEEQRAGYKFGFVSLCLMSGKLIARGLSFLFCTINVVIPTFQGGCKD